MLSSFDQRQILYLIEQGKTQSEVAKLTGFSRNAVRRLINRKKVRKRLQEKPFSQIFIEVCFSYLLQVETGEEGRCPTCGEKVAFPCRSCLMQQYKKISPGAPITDEFHILPKIQKELDSIEKLDQDEDDQDEDDQDEDDQGEDDATSED